VPGSDIQLYTRVEHKAQTLLEASRVELAEHLQGREDSYDDDEAEDDQTSTAEAAISQQERDQRLERNRLRTSYVPSVAHVRMARLTI
jgi:hypothetical protein